MVSGIWRRIRSLFAPESDPAEQATAPHAPTPPESTRPPEPPERYLPDLPFRPAEPLAAPEQPPQEPEAAPSFPEASSAMAPPPIEGPLPSLESLVERLSIRLLEDESLRSSLTDEEFQPLLDWALQRLGAVASGAARLSPVSAVAQLSRAGTQARELLRLIDLALGERDTIDPQLLRGRLELLDTLLEPPLLDPQTASIARARLEALLEQPVEQLRTLSRLELVRRLLQILA